MSSMSRYSRSSLRVYSGDGVLRSLPTEIERAGCSRPLIVCGPSVAAGEVYPHVLPALHNMETEVFDGVRAHSPLTSVDDLVERLKSSGADCIVAVGGGSAMITARAANVLHGEQSALDQVATTVSSDGTISSPRLMAAKLPHFVVPTTPTTAIAKAGAAVLPRGAERRRAMFDPATRAVAVFVDRGLCERTPSPLVTSATANTFTMCVEGLVSDRATVFARAPLAEAARTITVGGQHDRVALALAAIQAGEGTDIAGGGLAAALSHSLGHLSEVSNGTIDVILLPHVLDAIREVAGPRLASTGLFGDTGPAAIEAIGSICAGLSSVSRLRDAGIDADILPSVAEDAMLDVDMHAGPHIAGAKLALAVLQAAW